MSISEKENTHPRIGLHYYQDSLHYRSEDLKRWMPEFQKMGISWLVLRSSATCAIPEFFLRSLVSENINPIIEFDLPLTNQVNLKDLQVILQAYARWGVRYVIFFDRPNQKAKWHVENWMKNDLVDRFLDQYIPLAKLAIEAGLISIFPPMEPGGSYWDTAFLRACFGHLQRRKQDAIINTMVLAAYSHSKGKSLDWGLGGPEQWPETRPYITPSNSQDQLGFRIFDWYQAIAKAVFQKELPILLFQTGLPDWPVDSLSEAAKNECWLNQKEIILQLNASEIKPCQPDQDMETIPAQVLACNFWFGPDSTAGKAANVSWYQNNLMVAPCGLELVGLPAKESLSQKTKPESEYSGSTHHPIRHYVLLPLFESGVSDWHLAVVQPFIKNHHATLGFSLNEARLAAQVTVVANPKTIPDECLEDLRKSGCKVERISGDGTSIATKLAER